MPRWYKQLATWNKKYGESVQFLMFPCDEFKQELPADEIVPFLEGFKLTQGMPLNTGGVQIMAKVEVNGDNTHPVFTLAKESFPGDITWNFNGIFVFGACPPAHGLPASAPTLRRLMPTDASLPRAAEQTRRAAA